VVGFPVQHPDGHLEYQRPMRPDSDDHPARRNERLSIEPFRRHEPYRLTLALSPMSGRALLTAAAAILM
jgi:hypothetical protein